MNDVLKKIIDSKEAELKMTKTQTPVDSLPARSKISRPGCFINALADNDAVSIIAEFKRKSPSKGWINQNADLSSVVCGYQADGAAAVSVLTNGEYFGGSVADLAAAASAVEIPVLRKEFIVDPYQIDEAFAYGADAVLLIAAALEAAKISDLAAYAVEKGLDVLFEVHHLDEVKKLAPNSRIALGINNRDLSTFETSLETTVRIMKEIDKSIYEAIVAESGIHTREDLDKLASCGVDAALIGEALMAPQNASNKLREFTA